MSERQFFVPLKFGSEDIDLTWGSGSPEGSISSVIGSLYLRSDDEPALYVKEDGAGSSGWTSLIVSTPLSSSRNIIVPGAADVSSLVLKAPSSMTTSTAIFSVQQNDGTKKFEVGYNTSSAVYYSRIDSYLYFNAYPSDSGVGYFRCDYNSGKTSGIINIGSSSSANAGNIYTYGGAGTAGGGAGGSVNIYGGDGGSAGVGGAAGSLILRGGTGGTSGARTGGTGGTLNMYGGNAGLTAAGGNAGSLSTYGSSSAGGSIDTHGGSSAGGSISTYGGNTSATAGGSISTYGGSSVSATGGSISTYGGTSAGGSINTSDGGGAILTNSSSASYIQLGTSSARVSITTSSPASAYTATLPNLTGYIDILNVNDLSFAASQNDYAIGNQSFISLTATNTSLSLTGFAGGWAGRLIQIVNVGSNSFTISNESASSTAANRIATRSGSDITLAQREALILAYDSTNSRWRDVGLSVAASSGSPGGSDTNVQFNDSSSFGGSSDFTWNKTSKLLTVSGNLTLTPPVKTSGNPNLISLTGPAHTTLTAGETSDVYFNLGRTVQFTTGGTIALQRSVAILSATYSASSATQTITTAATLSISDAPAAGTNVTITNAFALYVQSGQTSVPSGSNSLPSICFTTDTNTGIYSDASDSFAISTGGTKRLSISSTSLTLTSITQILNLDGSAANPAYSFSTDSSTGIYYAATNTLNFSTAGTRRMYINGSTDIITTLPNRTADGSVSAPAFSFSGTTNAGMYLATTNTLGFATSGTVRFQISTTILRGDLPFRMADGSTSAPSYSFTNGTQSGMYHNGSSVISFASANSQKLRLSGHNSASPQFYYIGTAVSSLTASTEASQVTFDNAQTYTWSAGAISTQRAYRITAPTYAFASASTVTNAINVSITGAPVAGTNATLTCRVSLLVEDGLTVMATGESLTADLNPNSTQVLRLVANAGASGNQALEIDCTEGTNATTPFIDFRGDSAADKTTNVSTSTTWTNDGAIRVEINGTTKWILYYS